MSSIATNGMSHSICPKDNIRQFFDNDITSGRQTEPCYLIITVEAE